MSLQGSAKQNEVWTITLDSTPFRFTVGAGEDVLSRIAAGLATEIAKNADYRVELRISLLGTARLFISRANGAAFDLQFNVTAPSGFTTNGSAEISGTPVQSVLGSGIKWTQAAFP